MCPLKCTCWISFSVFPSTFTEERPLEDTTRPFTSQDDGLHQELNWPAPWSSQPPELWGKKFLFKPRRLLQQPELTETGTKFRVKQRGLEPGPSSEAAILLACVEAGLGFPSSRRDWCGSRPCRPLLRPGQTPPSRPQD